MDPCGLFTGVQRCCERPDTSVVATFPGLSLVSPQVVDYPRTGRTGTVSLPTRDYGRRRSHAEVPWFETASYPRGVVVFRDGIVCVSGCLTGSVLADLIRLFRCLSFVLITNGPTFLLGPFPPPRQCLPVGPPRNTTAFPKFQG